MLFILFLSNYFLLKFNYYFLSCFILPDLYFLFMIIFMFFVYLFILFRQHFYRYTKKYSLEFFLLTLPKIKKNGFSFFIQTFCENLHFIFNYSFISYFFMLILQFIKFYKFSAYYDSITFFYELLSIDLLICLIKLIICFFSFIIYNCIYYSNFKKINSDILISYGFSIISINFLLMSYNFIPFFISLEMFFTSIIILSALSSSDIYSQDSRLKYFKINSLASIFMLFSITLIYGFTGTFSFKFISILFCFSIKSYSYIAHLYMCVALSLFYLSFSYKLILAPFHI